MLPTLPKTRPAPVNKTLATTAFDSARRGLAHENAGAWAEAAGCYEAALALEPRSFAVTMNLAGVLARMQRFDAAEQRYREAIALQPASPAAWSNLGAMLAALHRDTDALACCAHALQLDPRFHKARFNLAYPLLRQGRWAEGLLCLEARPSLATLQAQLNAPCWAGEDLAARSLLLVSDAGHGDLIQMARYAAALRERGAGRLLLWGQRGLTRLLANDAGFDEVLDFAAPLPSSGWDLWAPTLSLPFLCGTRVEALPDHLPYLHPDPARVAHWQRWLQAFGPAPALRVGLVWRGDPRHENDGQRSLPGLATLAPLAAVAGVQWISLQRGAGEDEPLRASSPLPVQAPPEPLQDFADTAALVANLDLVIGVDTSTVHLAGALAKPVWVMLPEHLTDWRWLQERSDSPWYPGVMRLFRQRRSGDWAGLMAEVAAALREVPRRARFDTATVADLRGPAA